MPRKPSVFLSCRRKPEAHLAAVCEFAAKLKADAGVEVIFDEYAGDPDERWTNWMRKAVRDADKVLLVFNAAYKRCYEGDDRHANEGKGSTFEGILIVQELYRKGPLNAKFRAVITKPADRKHVSAEFQGHNVYCPTNPVDYDKLVKWLHAPKPSVQKKTKKRPAKKVAKPPACPDLFHALQQRLRQECMVIPIFGRIRDDIPMDRNFINVTLEASFADTKDSKDDDLIVPDRRKWTGADRGERDEAERKRAEMRSMTAKKLWSLFAKGVILGLPGAGKTTILRHFAHLEFTGEQDRIILFIPCRTLSSAHFHSAHSPRQASELQTALSQIVAAFLCPDLPAEAEHLSPAQRKLVLDFLPHLDEACHHPDRCV